MIAVGAQMSSSVARDSTDAEPCIAEPSVPVVEVSSAILVSIFLSLLWHGGMMIRKLDSNLRDCRLQELVCIPLSCNDTCLLS